MSPIKTLTDKTTFLFVSALSALNITSTMKALLILAMLASTLRCFATEIRVRNDSNIDFKEVVVGSVEYGDIKQGRRTGYEHWDVAYQYAFVSLLAGKKPHKYRPTDFSGERPLGDGKFTYVLTLENGELRIRAEKDVK